MRIFFSVGEPSGDLHGANLIRQLSARRPDMQFEGFGGPRMAAAGCRLDADLTELAIMGFAKALWHLPTFWRLRADAQRRFELNPPDAVVLIDYPGFNWHIAAAAKAAGVPVFYYGAPQLWAWASWRVEKMRRTVDHVLCKLPFEEKWFRDHGCNAHYVGHPYFDELVRRPHDEELIDRLQSDPRPLVAILPGSRTQEVANNLNSFLKTAAEILKKRPDVRFAVAAYNDKLAEMSRSAVADSGVEAEVYIDKSHELMQAADCCLACSGSVSLELMYYCKPTVILYQVTHLVYWLQRCFRTVRYITLTNLLTTENPLAGGYFEYDPDAPDAEPVPFPEYLTVHDKSPQMAAWINRWLENPAQRLKRIEWLHRLKEQVGQPGASSRGAEYILGELAGETSGEKSETPREAAA